MDGNNRFKYKMMTVGVIWTSVAASNIYFCYNIRKMNENNPTNPINNFSTNSYSWATIGTLIVGAM